MAPEENAELTRTPVESPTIACDAHLPIGVDILVVQDIGYVLDINLAPDLAVHLVTNPPRHLAPAVLDSWLAKDRRAESVYT